MRETAYIYIKGKHKNKMNLKYSELSELDRKDFDRLENKALRLLSTGINNLKESRETFDLLERRYGYTVRFDPVSINLRVYNKEYKQ